VLCVRRKKGRGDREKKKTRKIGKRKEIEKLENFPNWKLLRISKRNIRS
jgi:hypothetical protein